MVWQLCPQNDSGTNSHSLLAEDTRATWTEARQLTLGEKETIQAKTGLALQAKKCYRSRRGLQHTEHSNLYTLRNAVKVTLKMSSINFCKKISKTSSSKLNKQLIQAKGRMAYSNPNQLYTHAIHLAWKCQSMHLFVLWYTYQWGRMEWASFIK